MFNFEIRSPKDEVISFLTNFQSKHRKVLQFEMHSIGRDTRRSILESMKNTKRESVTYGERNHRPSRRDNPPAVDSGALYRSIRTYSGRDFTEVGTNLEYGRFLEYGTGIYGDGRGEYTIKAKGGGMLSWVVNGQRMFAKEVKHKGMRPRPWLAPAVEKMDIGKRLEKALRRAFV